MISNGHVDRKRNPGRTNTHIFLWYIDVLHASQVCSDLLKSMLLTLEALLRFFRCACAHQDVALPRCRGLGFMLLDFQPSPQTHDLKKRLAEAYGSHEEPKRTCQPLEPSTLNPKG